jgi:hypothetical protein
MRYCGNCGVSLSLDAFDIYAGHSSNVCPSCGAPISPTDNIESADTIDVAGEPTRQSLAALDDGYFSALPTSPEHSDSGPRTIVAGVRRIAVRPIALLALLVLALLLVFGSVLLLNNATGHPQLGLPLLMLGGDGSQSTATLSASQSAATQTNGAQSGPLLSPTGSPSTGTPVSGTPDSGTPTPDATVTITPAPGQPSLTVSPTKVSNLLCLNSSFKLTVTNTGNGAMTWSASGSRAAYKTSPQSGSLDSGQQQTVTVSGISASGTVTIDAPGAANSPQIVTITCTL